MNAVSDTYKKLYYEIIDPIFGIICNSNINYYIKDNVCGLPVPIAIYNKFEMYRNKALQNMHSNRLDRHKLASCLCGAMIEVQPFTGFHNAQIVKGANETIALYIGLSVIKMYMICDFVDTLCLSSKTEKEKVLNTLINIFSMSFPHNICDTQKYDKNFANALCWSHKYCEHIQDECFNYDIWAYSKIFYHLECYNIPLLKECYEKHLNNN